ncbi:MAG TPA: hypothetical protein V6D14_16845 [Coleofasciculaceae cyanobacterium]
MIFTLHGIYAWVEAIAPNHKETLISDHLPNQLDLLFTAFHVIFGFMINKIQ